MSKLTTKTKLSKLTPLEQELDSLKTSRNRILSAYSFKKLLCWQDYENLLGGKTLIDLWDAIQHPSGFGCITLSLIKQDLAQQEQHIRNKYANSEQKSLPSSIVEVSNIQDNTFNSLSKLRIEQPSPTLYPIREKRSPKQTCELFKQQEEAAQEAIDALFLHDKDAWLIRAGVGTGKTYVVGAAILSIVIEKFLFRYAPNAVCPWPIVYVTKASIVEQTKRVLETRFGLNVINQVVVTHYDALRATFGDLFIHWKTEIVNGEPTIKPIWRDRIHPVFFIWDECQALKNTDSLQSRVGQAVNDLATLYPNVRIKQLFLSATPFTRVCEAKCFAVATRVPYTYGIKRNAPLVNAHWTDFANHIAAPSKPDEHNEAAIGRLVDYLQDYIGGIKNLRPQFHARNGIKIIDFATREEHDQYHSAWQRFQEAKVKLEGKDAAEGGGRMAILAQFTIFRREAETIKAGWIAKEMYARWLEGYAPCAAMSFKAPITKIVSLLITKYGIPRDKISLIWGGMNKTKKVKKRKGDTLTEQQRQDIEDRFGTSGIEGAEDLFQQIMDMEDEVEEKVNEDIPKSYRLGNQSREERQREIDRFQSGASEFCLFTFKAGGVGLSLHHTDELTKQKVRHKPNGYAVEEDIGSIPTRPRCTILGVTYSAPELVQGLGRAPRLTSLSDTYQYVVFYRGTIEERVAVTVSIKLKCLKKVVKMRESWEDIVVNAGCGQDENYQGTQPVALLEDIKELPQEEGTGSVRNITLIQPDNPDEDSFLGGSDSEDEEEE